MSENSNNDATAEQDNQPETENRETYQRALQEELRELATVVGPGPLVDLLLERAFQMRATDIHLDPTKEGLRVRLRVDGLMHDVLLLPLAMMSQVVSRVKLMANMDITERRSVQDGHINNAVLQMQRDIRVGSGPTINGERLVLRLMPDSSEMKNLSHLGFNQEQMDLVDTFVHAPYGMILSVGPVGSGKSTTMYSCLEQLNSNEKSLVTIEDPVERRVDGVNQIQVEPRIDFSFVEALRGILRQDPNVMMVGEIRDSETAHIACRAALTGVLVLSTLHANDTASTIDVFREFGIPPMFIADSLQGVISQRLVRKVCDHCQERYKPDDLSCELLGLSSEQANSVELTRGTGCPRCFHTGHYGRTGIFEIMPVSGSIRDGILKNKSHHELMAIAREGGMVNLEEATRRKVLAGETSMSEFHRMLTHYQMLHS